eukprot:TRINITY_DN11525_c0_g1_i1.p1 TRINITY_DN11525_c0_g1~~TRINITY_DN11525_c0_g1_i1.p1  ORF type:complete len:212 (+),score=15.33 TRINITY_DN11525_c0_g1_i1:1490-2125(+)
MGRDHLLIWDTQDPTSKCGACRCDLPSGWGNFPTLSEVDLSNNGITGGIPSDLIAHPYLRNLTVANCSLNQPLPDVIPGAYLEELNLQHNRIPGNFTNGITQFNSLRLATIDLSFNNLSGPLPDRFPLNVINLRISNNFFSGPVPDWYFTALYLVEFTANDNQLSGPVRAMSSSTSIRRFVLSNNAGLTGCFSSAVFLEFLPAVGNSHVLV